MTMITSEQLALLQSRPQQTKLWLSVYRPPTVLQCTVNDASIGKGAMTIAYDNAVGNYTKIVGGMLMYVGTSAGSYDKGKVRVRSATNAEIIVAENSHINWADGDYLTVINYIEINPIYPRIIQNPADETDVIFYKDYDVAYTDQNSAMGAFVCMGGHYAGFVDDPVYYSASGTSSILDQALEYSWQFDGGTPTGSTAHTPGYVQYATPGHYVTKLSVSVTGSSVTEESYRYVSIYDRPENGTFNPTLQWEMVEFSGSREQGGYTASIKIFQDIDESVIQDGSLVTIFADDWYGDTKTSLGGNAQNRSSVVFVGYVLDGSIIYNYQYSTVEFTVGSVTETMKVSEGFSVSVETSESPGTWFELLDMDIRRAIYHYLKWHSTVLQTTDFEYRGYNPKIQYFDADRASLYESVEGLMRSALYGDVVADRQGKLWAEVDVAAVHNAADYFPTAMNIRNEFWMNEPSIEVRNIPEQSYLETGGIAYSGVATGTFTAFMSAAPGTAPSYRGKADGIQGLALTSQEQLNELTGDIFAYNNSKYPLVSLELSGNYRNLDIAPQELVSLTVMPNDTARRLVWIEKPFSLRSMSMAYFGKTNTLLPSITLSEVTAGFAGDSIPIPELEDSGGFLDIPFDGFSFGRGGGIDLYDEGRYLGRVKSLNFVGMPVEATISEYDGTVVYNSPCTCDPIMLSMKWDDLASDNSCIGWSEASCGEKNIGCFDETLAGNSAYYDLTGLESSGKLILQVSGHYRIWFDIFISFGQFSGYTEGTYATAILRHFSSVGELKHEYRVIGRSIGFMPEGIGGGSSSAEITAFLRAEMNDYIQFSAIPSICKELPGYPPGSETVSTEYCAFYVGRI